MAYPESRSLALDYQALAYPMLAYPEHRSSALAALALLRRLWLFARCLPALQVQAQLPQKALLQQAMLGQAPLE
jgi:hypothetical protein